MTTRPNQPAVGERGNGPKSGTAFPPSATSTTPRVSKAVNDDSKPAGDEPLGAKVQEQIESAKAGLADLKEKVSSGIATGMEEAKTAASDAMEKVEGVASDAQDVVTKASRRVVETIKANPIPAAMVGLGGIGLAMLFASGRPTSRAKGAPTDRSVDPGSGQASATVGRAKQSIGNMSHAASQTFQRTSQSAQAQARKLGKAVEDNPIKVSAGALLVGVGVGLMLPSSARENQWLGATRDSMVAKGHALANQALDKVETARQLVTGSHEATSDSA